MKVLLYPHAMELGGSQINALQLAGAVRDRGHEVIVLSEPGPLVERVHRLGLEHVEVPLHRGRPSPHVCRMIGHLIASRKIDVVHGHEWPPIIDGFFGGAIVHKTPVIGTIMSMSVPSFLPRSMPLTVGTELIRQSAYAMGYRQVHLLEPPVDTQSDHPDLDGGSFRATHGVRPDEILIAMVCRLVPDLKLEGLLNACDAARDLAAAGKQVRLVIVGDGRARSKIEARAAKINAELGHKAVLLAGEMPDPSTAYAAADILVGQGGSALRSMAFAKPLVVVGEAGFSELLTPGSAPTFLRQGWYGLGRGALGTGAPALRAALQLLVDSASMRHDLGRFGRELAEQRFSLTHAAGSVEHLYATAVDTPSARPQLLADAMRVGTAVCAYRLRRKYLRYRGTAAADDQNAREVIAAVFEKGNSNGTARPEGEHPAVQPSR